MRWLVVLMLVLLAVRPAFAQTDDRILNDVFAVLKGEAMLAETRRLCLDFAETDLAADSADWADRNAGLMREADLLLMHRPGLEAGMLETMREAAASEAGRSFARETDRPAYCESLGEAMAAGGLDLPSWFPAETGRMTETLEGKWPPLDLAGSRPVAEAMEVKKVFFAMQDGLVRCGVLFPPAKAYDDAWAEWQARNSYSRDLAEKVLKNWGALHPRRWDAARDEAGAMVDAVFADQDAARAYCSKSAEDAVSGALDLDAQRPDLYDSVTRNAEIMP